MRNEVTAMADYIEREAVKAKATSGWVMLGFEDDVVTVDDIDSIPAADVAPVVHGHWIDGADSFGAKRGAYRVCSHCNICIPNTKMIPDRYWQGCPNCLTRMDGGDGNGSET